MRDGSATGCIIELDGSYAVGQPGIMAAAVMHEDVTCHGASDGSITINDPSGGSGSYQYRVSGRDWQGSGLFEGLASGSYIIEIRDAVNPSCIILVDDAYSLNEPAALNAGIDFAHVTGCHGDATGWIEIINATGSWAGVTGNYRYSINGGTSWSSSALFDNLSAGTYNVQIRDGDNPGCSFIIDDNVVLSQPDPVTSGLEVVDVSCFGGSNGSIMFVNVLGGSGTYEYVIQGPVSINQTNPLFPDLPSGTYRAIVQNLAEPSCPVTINPALILAQPGELAGTVSKTDVSGCSGDSNGEIEIISPAGGSGNYQFSADDGVTWQDNNHFGGMAAGTWMVWIRDRDEVSCTMFLGVAEILEPAELYSELEAFDAGCFNGADGSILVTSASGGSGNWEFSLDGVSWQDDQLFSSLPAGDYSVLMRDRDFPLCESSAGLVTVGQPEIISLDISAVTGNECFGADNGSITALASGGTPGYTYSLYNGGVLVETLQPVHPAGAVFSALPSGNNYRIAVTDTRGCNPAEIASIVVPEPAEIEISSVVPVDVDCYGEESGSITVLASGGTGQLLYSINGNDFLDNGGIFENLPSGLFDISVMDGNGCRRDYGQVEINSPALLSAQVSATDISCFGLTDGTIEILNTQGGTQGNYEYSTDGAVWSANPLFENLAPGSYNVFIRDADAPSCLTLVDGSPVLLSEPALLEITTELTHITCSGLSSGAIEVTAGGGTGSYQYRLNAGPWQANPVFGSLPAGNYLVRVSDANGCEASEPVTLTAPDEMIIQNIVKNDESCFGAGDGSIEIFMTGGTPPYRYSSDGGVTFQDERLFENLAPGIYSLVTEDALGCMVVFGGSIVIEDAPEITLDMLDISNVSCNGAGDGGIVAVASGGAGGMQYSIDGVTWQPDGIFTGLDAGDYVIYIRDIEGCVITGDFTIIQPGGIAFTVWHEDIECHGAEDGIIHVSIDTGMAPFTFRLFDASTGTEVAPGQVSSVSAEFTGLAAGSYYVMVVDGNGCMSDASGTVLIIQPDELLIDSVVAEDISCHGANDGTITIITTGGTGNKEYSMDGGLTFLSNGGLFTGLVQGSFDIVVRDENGCETVYPGVVTINDPPLIGLGSVAVTDALCFGSLTGSIAVTGTGGTGQLLYSLDNDSYQLAGVFNSLSAGAYTLYIKDENNCIRVFTIPEVGQPDMLSVTAQVLNIDCFTGAGTPAISASPAGGVSPYTLTLYQGGTQVQTISGVAEGGSALFGSLTAGLTDYWVIADDSNGCGPANSGMLSTVVPGELLAGSISVTDAECYGVAGGIIEISALGGTAPYLFSLYTQADDWAGDYETGGTAVFDQLFAGTYRVEIFDANGCGPAVAGDIIIGQPAEFILNPPFISHISCFGESDGSLNIIALGGAGQVEYSINNGASYYASGFFTDLPAGLYEVLARDGTGCVLQGGTVEIIAPDRLIFDEVQVENIPGGSPGDLGSILVIMAGGTAPYEYSINSGISWQIDNLFPDLTEGQYTILVSDANGCTADTTVIVVVDYGITLSVQVAEEPYCHGDVNGMLIITAGSGTGPYEYSIDGGLSFQASGIFTDLPASVYWLVARDAFGLTGQLMFNLSQPGPLVAGVSVGDAWCRDFSPDGSVELDVTGGTIPYSFIWSDGATTRDIAGIDAGEYDVRITDARGCEFIIEEITVGFEHSIGVTLPEEYLICHGAGVNLETGISQTGLWVEYSWTSSDGADPDPVASPWVNPLLPVTVYTVMVADENNCRNEASVSVSRLELQGLFIGNDTILFRGTTIELEAGGGDFINYEWTPSTGLSSVSGKSTTALVMNDTEYFVYAETAEGCIESDNIFIRIVSPVEPVSGFTPNGDGVNDFFEILNAADYPGIVVEVFNRAGQRVFYSKGYSDDRLWNGTYNGRDLPMGTYYFVITLNDGFGTRPLSGPVTIVR
jgi:large repetitive protein